MSTTIDSGHAATRSLARRCGRFIGAALLVVAIWFSALAALLLMIEPTRDVIVFGPPEIALGAVVTSSSLAVDAGSSYVMARGQHHGFVRALYAGGAWLVLPAISGGCRTRPRA